jgi:AmmeMemoRadiSam system protein B
MSAISEIRPSPIAGRWYSGDPQALANSIDRYLSAPKLPPLPGRVVALIVPHAGHLYSGPVAGYGFRTVSGMTFDLVAVVAPMHQFHPQPLLTSAHRCYGTPLGQVPVDREAINRLDAALNTALGFGLTPVANDTEHSLEIELPFLQRALAGPFKLLPVMMREQSPLVARALGETLAQVVTGQSVLLVASTDLSHFYTQREAASLDQAMLDQVAAFSPEGVFAVEAAGKGFACGLAPLAAVLWAARSLGADSVQVLRHATSGDITGDFSSVVGYGSAVALKAE